MTGRFGGDFATTGPIPEEGVAAAVALMRSGRLRRYGGPPDAPSEVALLEEFAAFLGVPFALAPASGGTALTLALRAAGVRPGERVLTNAWTLAPVTGAVAAVGATLGARRGPAGRGGAGGGGGPGRPCRPGRARYAVPAPP